MIGKVVIEHLLRSFNIKTIQSKLLRKKTSGNVLEDDLNRYYANLKQ